MNALERFRELEWLDVIVVGLVVVVAFAFTLVCTLIGGSAGTADSMRTDPDAFSTILLRCFGILMLPGMLITSPWLVGNPLGHPLAAFSVSIAINTAIYTVVFGLLLRFLRRFVRKSD